MSAIPNPAIPRSGARNYPSPLDVIFIFFTAAFLAMLILSFSQIYEFSDTHAWLGGISSLGDKIFFGTGAVGCVALRRWLDRNPTSNFLFWIPVFTVSLLLLAYGSIFFTRYRNSKIPVAGGSIDLKEGQTIGRTTLCKGEVSGFKPGMHLWLAVEVNNRVWPKEGEVQVADGKWQKELDEDGRSPELTVSLFQADSDAEKQIAEWIKESQRTGKYKGMIGEVPGTTRICRASNLRVRAR